MNTQAQVRLVHPRAVAAPQKTNGGDSYVIIWADSQRTERLATGNSTAKAWRAAATTPLVRAAIAKLSTARQAMVAGGKGYLNFRRIVSTPAQEEQFKRAVETYADEIFRTNGWDRKGAQVAWQSLAYESRVSREFLESKVNQSPV